MHSHLLLLDDGVVTPPPVQLVLPEDKREGHHWQGRQGKPTIAIVEHIGVAPTYTSLVGYLKGNNDRQVSATIVVGGDYVGQFCVIVGSGTGASLSNERMLRAANHAGIQSFPNTNPRPDLGNPNHWTIGKEHVGYPGQVWTPTMVQNDKLCNDWIRTVVPGAFTHILGHYNFDPVNRINCPGPTFPWHEIYPGVRRLRMTKALGYRITGMQKLLAERKDELTRLEPGDFKGYEKLLVDTLA